MENGIILNQSDIKKIIAKYFGIDEKKVMPSKYSFIVTGVSNEKLKDIKE